MIRKSSILLILIIFLFCCSYVKENKDIQIYHLVYFDTFPLDQRWRFFDINSIRYIGKLSVNQKTKEIKCDCLKEEDKKEIESSLGEYAKKDSPYGLTYATYYKEKPNKVNDEFDLDYISETKQWVLYKTALYTDADFWDAFKISGLITTIHSEYGGLYHVIDPKVGEKYFKAKKEGLGDKALVDAVKLNEFEEFVDKI